MGIVNITPDSFSDGGLYLDRGRAIDRALQLLDEGADLIDLGAESSRPGSSAGPGLAGSTRYESQLTSEEELARLLPVLKGVLQARPGALVSVDTYKSKTARAALEGGAEIVNDVSGFLWDNKMASLCAESGCGVVLMHTRGTPGEWRTQRPLASEEILPQVRAGLSTSLNGALGAGVERERVVLDPGYGFGKRLEENYVLLGRQAELLSLGRPLLAGLSRKSFLTQRGADVARPDFADDRETIDLREAASIAGVVASILAGASIVRVHTVRAAVAAAAVADSVLRGG